MPFIVFEGLDGSGKSTLIKGLHAELDQRSLPLVITREPGGTPLGEEVRTLLLRTTGEPPCPRAEALLYQAGRAQHVDKVIRPALARKDWVLCDRFTASSVAFQGAGRDLYASEIIWLNRFSTQELEPDLNVLLDLSVEESLKRLKGRGQEIDRFEQEDQAFHERVRRSYLKMAEQAPAQWLVLSSTENSETLRTKLIAELKRRQWLA